MTQSEERKIQRKKRRILSALRSSDSISVSDSSSSCVLAGNAGLATGDSLETLLAQFPEDCSPIDVVMPPGRHFSLLKFADEAAAARAFVAVETPSDSRPVYLFYVLPREFERVASLSASCVPPFASPSGARLICDFVSEEEERGILDTLDWSTADSLKQRRVFHFGHVFDYSTNGVSRTEFAPPLPDWSRPLIGRLLEMGLVDAAPDQLTINCYAVGQGIPAHVDTHSVFSACLVSVSLQSACTMEFDTADAVRERCWLRLPRRSALLLTGDSRYRWRHAIGARRCDVIRADQSDRLIVIAREPRVSLTFRRLMPEGYVCRCLFPRICDSQQQHGGSVQDRSCDSSLDRSALELERVYVSDVYDRIAEHFSHTRHTPWPAVARFVESVSAEGGVSLLLDVGCGNGRHLALSGGGAHVLALGVDGSARLCSAAAGGAGDSLRQLLVAHCLSVPLRSGLADCLLCVAVLHHLASRRRRVLALMELARLLAPGARALVTVWAREQRRSAYVTRRPVSGEVAEVGGSGGDLPLPVHVNRTEFRQQDVLVPWKLQSRRKPATHTEKAQYRRKDSEKMESRGKPSSDLEKIEPGGEPSSDLEEMGPRDKPSPDPDEVQLRYYHVYREGELEEEVSAVESVKILQSYYDQGNWCVIFEKSVKTGCTS